MALLFRLRADQKVYNATTGTTAASDGGAVGSWEPAEGLITTRALHATKGPTYRANDSSSGYPGLEWASGKLLTMAHSTEWTGWSSFSWLVCLRGVDVASAGQNRYLWSRIGGWSKAGCRLNAGNYTEDIFTWHDGNYTGRKSSESPPNESTATRFVLAGSADGTKICTYVNRQSTTRRAITQSIDLGTSSLTIGEDSDGAGTYNLTQGTLYEVAFWNAALTESEMATEIDTVMSRWGVTNTVTPPSTGGGMLVPLGMGGGFGG